MQSDDRERRESTRLEVELSVEVRHLGRPDESFADVTRDLGAGGLFIDTTVGLPLGTPVSIEVTVGDGGRPITVEGEVVRVECQTGMTGSKADRRVCGLAISFEPKQRSVAKLLERVSKLRGEEAP